MSSPKKGEKLQGYDYIKNAMSDYPAFAKFAYHFVLGVVYLFARLVYPTRFEHEGELVADMRAQGCMVVGNHVSMVEPVVFITRMWRHGIKVRPVYKAEFEKIAPAKWLFRHLGGIPVDRGSADLRALRAAKEALVRGECVLVYPEGTRIKDDEQPVELHGGFAMIAQMAKAPVIPTAVVGAADPYHTRPTRRRHPIICAGEPITFSSLGVEGRKAQLARMEEVAVARMYALRDQLREEHPGLW